MKIAIIGCGSIGRCHARNAGELGVTDLLLVDPLIERANSLAQELNGTGFSFPSSAYEQSPDVAMICAPTSMHLWLAHEALQHSCHVFVEKPLCDSTEGAYELLGEANARGRILLVGYNFRFDPIIMHLRKWLAEGTIERVTNARFHFGSYLPWRHPWEDYRRGYGARRDLGGGVILDAIHELDMVLLLFGWPETIYCAGGKYSDLELDSEDLAEIVISYADKIASVHLDYIQRPAERRIEIIGTRGRIEADLFARTLRYFDGNTREWVHCDACGTIEETYKSEMRHLLDCVAGAAIPTIGGATAIDSLLLADWARTSMHSKFPVSADACAIAAGAR